MKNHKMKFISYSFLVVFLGIIVIACKTEKKKTTEVEKKEENPVKTKLKESLTFYASFDNGVDADFAKGDKLMYSVSNRKELDSAKIGLDKEGVSIVENQGRFGNGLQYTEKSKGYIYYKSKDNMNYVTTSWEGAISFWLSLDPDTDLKPGYCDPIQITDSGYNDAGFWVDFTKENPRDFRLGVIGDRDSWNPTPEGPDNENPIFIEQLPVVKNPPFETGKWTHVVINFTGLNTEDGKAALYLNGEMKGIREQLKDPFTWEIEQSNIYLGLSYIGLMDEVSIYNKHLSKEEIKGLYELENGVKELISL